MANNLADFRPEYWADVAQTLHKPRAIYRQIANFRGESKMKSGDTFHRVIPSTTYIQSITRGSDLTAQTLTDTDESLSINKEYGFLLPMYDLDEVQSNVRLTATFLDNAMMDLTNVIDSHILFEVTNATSSLDAGNFGGTSGLPLTLSGSNVFDAFAKAKQKLAEQNISLERLYGVIDPATANVIESQLGARETAMGDATSRNGYTGNMLRYAGIDLYVTNNYTRSVQLNLATQPTADDTVTLTVGGVAVTFTFVASPSAAGDIDIGANVDATRGYLETLINAPGTSTATGIAFTGATLAAAQNLYAVNDDTNNVITIYSKGKTIVGTETLTDATDGFDSTEASSYLMIGQKGAVDVVMMEKPMFEMRPEPKQFTTNLMGQALWGQKTFTDGAAKLVNLRVLAS